MEKNYSYIEFRKTIGRNYISIQAEKILDEIYMDLFLNYIYREQTEKRLEILINKSLDDRDEQLFLKYSKELSKIKDAN